MRRWILVLLILLFASPALAQQAADTSRTEGLTKLWATETAGVTAPCNAGDSGSCLWASSTAKNSYQFEAPCGAVVVLNENTGGTGDNTSAVVIWRAHYWGATANGSTSEGITLDEDGEQGTLTKGIFFIQVTDAPTANELSVLVEFQSCY